MHPRETSSIRTIGNRLSKKPLYLSSTFNFPVLSMLSAIQNVKLPSSTGSSPPSSQQQQDQTEEQTKQQSHSTEALAELTELRSRLK